MSITRQISKCRSCEARIVWCVSEANGKRMPVDADPVVGGNLVIIPNPIPSARVVDPTPDMFDDNDTGIRYVAHFVTCPHADDWRAVSQST